MQRRQFATSTLASAALLATTSAAWAQATATVGQAAPNFSAKDVTGKTVSLADFKGKTVVLEWVNPGCPYVRKHYDGGNMQGTQQDALAKNVVWLAINSTGNDHPDYLAPAKLSDWMKKQKAPATHTLMDEDGKIGKAYGARTTPHMYIVDGKGMLVYAGGIDSIPSASASDIPKATNYIKVSLSEMAGGKAVSNSVTRPYGCSVKYKS
ncbi:MAG: thioredoxin family protein [Burkholderiales bacterium]|nr:MAG: thioredoxin family protein [Burkholderiales bacterium]